MVHFQGLELFAFEELNMIDLEAYPLKALYFFLFFDYHHRTIYDDI